MSSDRVNDRLDSIFGAMDGGGRDSGAAPPPGARPPSDFATTHRDLRKAVNQAQGIVGLLAHAGLSEHQSNLLAQIQQAIRDLARLINHELRAPVPSSPATGGSPLGPMPGAPTPRNAVPAASPLAAIRKPFGAPAPAAASPPPATPVAHVQHPPQRSVNRVSARTAGQRATILLGDGIGTNHRLFSSLLGRVDCGIEIAESGQLVIDKLSRSIYDMVILNCHLPQLNGFEVVTAIRQHGHTAHGSQPLPVILYADPELRGYRERVQALDVPFFAKPYDLVSLEKLLQRFLPRCDDVQAAPGDSAAAIPPDLVDTSILNALCERVTPQEFVSTYQRYLERSPKLIVEILQSMSGQAIDRMEQSAAVLLNSSVELGAVGLAERCRAITALCRAGNVGATAGLVVGLDGVYRRTCEALQTAVEAAFQV